MAWLVKPAVEATASAVKTSIEKLEFLRAMDAHLLDLSMLPAERRRFLATVGRRSTVQALERRGERRYPILLALVAQSAVDQLDEVVSLFDQAVSAWESRAKSKTDEALAERAKTPRPRSPRCTRTPGRCCLSGGTRTWSGPAAVTGVERPPLMNLSRQR